MAKGKDEEKNEEKSEEDKNNKNILKQSNPESVKKDPEQSITDMLKQVVVKKILDTTGNNNSANNSTNTSDLKEIITALTGNKQSNNSNNLNMQDIFQAMLMMKMLKEDDKPAPVVVPPTPPPPPPPEKNEMLEVMKVKLMMDAMSGGKGDDIDKFIKIMSIVIPKEDKTLEYLKQERELAKLEHQHDKEREEDERRHEKELREKDEKTHISVEELRKEILRMQEKMMTPVEPVRNQSPLDVLQEQFQQQAQLQKTIQNYAEQMGWGPREQLPAKGEKWDTDDYLKAFQMIGKTVSESVNGFVSANKELRTVPTRKEYVESSTAPIPDDVMEYLNRGTENEEGFVDEYGNVINGEDGKPLKKATIISTLKQRPSLANTVRQIRDASRQAYEQTSTPAVVPTPEPAPVPAPAPEQAPEIQSFEAPEQQKKNVPDLVNETVEQPGEEQTNEQNTTEQNNEE